jgi:hypothetical protein
MYKFRRRLFHFAAATAAALYSLFARALLMSFCVRAALLFFAVMDIPHTIYL